MISSAQSLEHSTPQYHSRGKHSQKKTQKRASSLDFSLSQTPESTVKPRVSTKFKNNIYKYILKGKGEKSPPPIFSPSREEGIKPEISSFAISISHEYSLTYSLSSPSFFTIQVYQYIYHPPPMRLILPLPFSIFPHHSDFPHHSHQNSFMFFFSSRNKKV